MTFRRFLFSLTGVVALSSAVMASPPSRSGSEGRELDPIARDFFASPPSASETPAPAQSSEKPADSVHGLFFWSLFDVISNSFTIPLGAVQPRLSR